MDKGPSKRPSAPVAGMTPSDTATARPDPDHCLGPTRGFDRSEHAADKRDVKPAFPRTNTPPPEAGTKPKTKNYTARRRLLLSYCETIVSAETCVRRGMPSAIADDSDDLVDAKLLELLEVARQAIDLEKETKSNSP
ncbi:hypothetical protein COL154_013048 [Colletotrichum chrysophilum]|nr:hypothetical protein COL154_013048 [Colletotrichum chrysophilum]